MKLITNHNNDEHFLNLFSNLADCILVINNIGEIVYLNPVAERLFSISAIDFVGSNINSLIDRFDSVKADHLIDIKNNNQQMSINLQIHSLPFGKEVYDVLLLKQAVEDKKMDDELVTRLIKEIEDIELAINESSNVSVTDGNGVITMVNKNFCNMTKYLKEEVIGKTHRILNSGFHPNEFFHEMWDTIKSGKVWRGEIQNKSKDGALYWHDTTIVPFLDDEGKAYKYVSVRNDITKRVKMEQALQINFMDTIENLQNGIFKMKKDANGNLVYTMAAGKLRKAILNNEFIAHFQPRVNALTGEIISAEALIRWEHPVMGLISPGDFIPLAEETGLIIPLGKWMKRKVCEQLVTWREAGIPLIPISVNISSQRLLQKEFAKDLKKLLGEFQLDGKWLEIEITENSIMKNEEYILQTLRDLKELGVKIYIDDFGIGYSSFNYLKTFNIDGVKIDRSFIQNISSKSENASITTTMIKMAQHLKMDVIAEGVETKEELVYLLEQNCYHIQGYYFGKPCSIEEFETKFLFQNN